MRATAPTRSVATLILDTSTGLKIDIKVYKKCEPLKGIGLERHMYHDEDNGRVRRINVCEDCGEQLDPSQIMRLAELEDAYIEVPREVVKEAWAAGDVVKAISFPSNDRVMSAIIDDIVCLKEAYSVYASDRFDERLLNAWMSALKKSGRVALVDIPLNDQVRRALLFPNGTMYSLYYETEIRKERDPINKEKKIDASLVETILAKISKKRVSIGKSIPKIDVQKVWDDLAKGA